MTSCSVQSAAVAEPLAGTAPVARSWIVVEHPGPWGRDALTDSALPAVARDALLEAKALGIGVLLARHPDRLGSTATADGRRVWVARAATGGQRLRHAVLPDLDSLARWDLAALAAGTLPPMGSAQAEPLLLVCTHSKRDVCCAVHGRALVAALHAAATPEQRTRIWECSHVGGHRFAPVTVSLPSGAVHGRLPVDAPDTVLARLSHGQVWPEHLRGRSCLPPALQAVDAAVRGHEEVTGADDLDILLVRDERTLPVEPGWSAPDKALLVEARHADGRAWRADVHRVAVTGLRAESCGAEPGPVAAWTVSGLVEAPPWR